MTAISNANLPVSNGSGDAALAHIQSTRVIGSLTIAVDTISNWPANFIATTGTLLSSGFIDPTSKTDFYGHLGTGNQLVIDGFCPGNSDNGNTSGQVVVIKPNTEWANLIAQGVQSTTQFPSQFNNFLEPNGGIWTQISTGLAGTSTAGNVWYSGQRYAIPAVATYTFTASKDTYVDVNPATGAFTYVPVTNGAAEPSVTASSVRVAKVITGASAITSISQTNYNTQVSANNINFTTFNNVAKQIIIGSATGVNDTNIHYITLPTGLSAVRFILQGVSPNAPAGNVAFNLFDNTAGTNSTVSRMGFIGTGNTADGFDGQLDHFSEVKVEEFSRIFVEGYCMNQGTSTITGTQLHRAMWWSEKVGLLSGGKFGYQFGYANAGNALQWLIECY